MRTPPALTRRRLLGHGTQLAVASTGLLALSGCGNSPGAQCFNPDNRSKEEVFARSSRGYVEQSPTAEQNCGNCDLFSADEGGCGSCTIDNLPANADGYCTSWSAPA